MLNLFIIFGGLFSLMAGILNWDWYYKTYPAPVVVWLMGRIGARIFYGLLGVFMMCMGLFAY